jgi:hypothetical protein
VVLPLFCSCGESRLFVSWCAGDRCDTEGSDEECGRSRSTGAEDWGWSSTGRVLGGRMIQRSDDAVWDQYRAQGDEEREFLGLASKPLGRVSWFEPQNRQLQFGDFGLKITTTVSWFGPQNQVGYDLSVASQNWWRMKTTWDTCRDLAICFAWKQVGLGFPSLASILVETRCGWCMWYHHRGCIELKLKTDMVDATGCIGSLDLNFAVFIALDINGILVF